MMLTFAFMLAMQVPAQERPAPPADAELIAAVQTERPNARILSHTFERPSGTPARRVCGLIEIGGAVEPFSSVMRWRDNMVTVTSINGVSVPPRPTGWEIDVSTAYRGDANEDGEIDRRDRTLDAMGRRAALRDCPGLTPPDGVAWTTEPELDPDPVRRDRNQRRAAALTNMLFGAGEASSPSPAPRRE